ncbi:MAG TPA: Ig-like domain-containing protein [Steroidobacteraceae bacterium]
MAWIRQTRRLALLGLLASAGCAGNGQGLDQNGRPVGSDGGSGAALTADLQSIQDNIFTPICTRCHIGASAPEGLRLDAADSFDLLVGISSAEEPNVLRVAPGDPDNSYLIRKLEGSSGIVGVQMPFGGPYLPQATIDVIRQWITNGAQKPQSLAATLQSRAFAVTGTSPMDGATLMQPVTQMLVGFNHDVDATLVNETTVKLERLPESTAGGEVITVTAPARLVASNAAVIVLATRTPLAAGTYRVSLRGTGAAALADTNAASLGLDYSFAFTVTAAP